MAIFQPQIVGKGGSNQDIQYDVMPEATIENLGRVIQYVGDTIPDTKSSATIEQTVGSGLTNLAVDVEKFEKVEQPGDDCTVDFVAEVIPGRYVCNETTGTGRTITCVDFEGLIQAVASYVGWSEEFTRENLQTQCNYNYFPGNMSGERQSIWFTYSGQSTGWLPDGFLDPFFTFEPEMATENVKWNAVYIDGNTIWKKDEEEVSLDAYGISYDGVPNQDDTLSVTYSAYKSGYVKGYFYENQAKYSDPSATISQTVGSGLSDLSVNVDKFIETEQPSEDETVDFVSSGAQYSITPTHWNNYGLDIAIDDANLFINQILERRPDVSITKEWNNIQSFYFCCIYNGQQINRIVIMANGYQTEYDVDSSWGVTINGDQSDNPDFWRNYFINTVSVEDGWVKDDEVINISDYGISYEGLSVEGDTLTVEYVAPSVIGYNWVQKDVQAQPEIPEPGIDWKTKLDVPADYPQSYSWSCAPIYTVPGGLPDGKYEVYWQILCPKAYNNENIPFGKVTYKAEFGIYTSGSSRRTYGRVSYVMNGEWLDNGDYMPNDSSYSSILCQNGEDLIFFSTNTIFRTTIVANRPNTFVPECFKLSAFKNLDTGEEYIATGDLYMGITPSYTKMISGSWSTRRLAEVPYVPNYRNGNSGQYNDSQQYIYLQPSDCIGNKIIGYSSCAGIDFSIKASNGDEYHVIVENSTGGSSIAKVQKATGNLANAQIGYDQYGNAYVYLNTPSGTSDQIEFYLSLIGATNNTAGSWFGTPGSFTPIAETRVGSAINENNIGHIEQYTGETTAEYTNGYFYKATGTEVFIPEGATCEYYTGQYTQPTINNLNTFISTVCNYWGWTKQDLINNLNRNHHWEVNNNNDGTISVYYSALGWMYNETAQTIYSCMSFDPIIETGNWTGFWIIYSPEHREYIDTCWEQVNVQSVSKTIFRQWVS